MIMSNSYQRMHAVSRRIERDRLIDNQSDEAEAHSSTPDHILEDGQANQVRQTRVAATHSYHWLLQLGCATTLN